MKEALHGDGVASSSSVALRGMENYRGKERSGAADMKWERGGSEVGENGVERRVTGARSTAAQERERHRNHINLIWDRGQFAVMRGRVQKRPPHALEPKWSLCKSLRQVLAQSLMFYRS